jgi:hypothetical protein
VICRLPARSRFAYETSPNQAPIDKRRIKTIFDHFRDKPARELYLDSFNRTCPLISFFLGAFIANGRHAKQVIEVSSQTGKSV